MTVLIIENNLLWSRRLTLSLEAAGHIAVVASSWDSNPNVHPDVALVNLSNPSGQPTEQVKQLKANGVYVLGHAGHKEKDLIEAGKRAGCDQIVSNGQLTFKLAEILSRIANAR